MSDGRVVQLDRETYVESICLTCASTTENWEHHIHCQKCGGIVVLLHAANTEEGRGQVQRQMDRLKNDLAYREQEGRRFQPGK